MIIHKQPGHRLTVRDYNNLLKQGYNPIQARDIINRSTAPGITISDNLIQEMQIEINHFTRPE